MTFTRRLNVTAIAAALIGTFPAVSLAARPGYAPLPASVVAFGADVRVLGDAAPGSRVPFAIALRPRNVDRLSARAAAGLHVGTDELSKTFLPSEADYNAVLAWLRANGLSVDRVFSTRLMIEASGSVADVSRALDVHFESVSVGGQEYVSASSEPSLPAALAPLVTSINGLQPHLHLHTDHIRAPVTHLFGGYTPLGVLTAYNATKLTQTGAGTTTAIIIDTVPLASDLTTFWSDYKVPQSLNNITYENVTNAPLPLPAPTGEETIDVEMSSSIAPGSNVRIYATASLAFTATDNAYEAIILDYTNGRPSQQVSVSLGACETGVSSGQRLTDEYYHAILASLGATVLIASGDSGSAECGAGNGNIPSFASTSPYVTGVGGTHLVLNSKGVVTSETAWSGSGGGLSQYYATPSFQSGLGLPSRGAPDVAAVGDPATGVSIYLNGAFTVYGGTSVAAPIWAGFMARVNQARLAASKPSLGQLTTRIYPLLLTNNFRDITKGSNGGYRAKVGYDLVTGIGTPLMATLLPTLTAQQ